MEALSLHHSVEGNYVQGNEAYSSNVTRVNGLDHKWDLILLSLVSADIDFNDLLVIAANVQQ